jgi:putative hemolysin
VLAAMQRSRVHLAGVRDRDGSLVGVVTLEDVLEELVGRISDETDDETDDDTDDETDEADGTVGTDEAG